MPTVAQRRVARTDVLNMPYPSQIVTALCVLVGSFSVNAFFKRGESGWPAMSSLRQMAVNDHFTLDVTLDDLAYLDHEDLVKVAHALQNDQSYEMYSGEYI